MFRSAYVPHDLKAPLTGAAAGPLSGLSVAVKDMYAIAGERAGGGSPAWLSYQSPASKNAAVVDKILAAGGTITGKTICDEFFYSVTGTNHHYGTPLNLRAPGRIPGGSSSGSASACSAGSCDIAIGSDTGGSVRVPAALCGVYGIRVSRGRMDLDGAMSMAPSFDAGGWFAASPGLLGLAGPVLLNGWDADAPAIRQIRILVDAFGHVDPAVAALSRNFLEMTRASLPEMTEAALAGADIERWREALRLTQAYEVWQTFGGFVSRYEPDLGPGVAERMALAASVGADQLSQSRGVLDEVRAALETATSDQTVLVLPTCPSVAPLLTADASELESFRVNTMRLICMASISGLPQITIPIGTLAGAPVGLSFIGWRYGEEALLGLAKRLGPFVGCSA